MCTHYYTSEGRMTSPSVGGGLSGPAPACAFTPAWASSQSKGREMNEVDKHARLINNLMELEEAAVLTQIRERVLAWDDPFEITEAAQHALHLVGERHAQGGYYISSMMMPGRSSAKSWRSWSRYWRRRRPEMSPGRCDWALSRATFTTLEKTSSGQRCCVHRALR